MKRNDRDSGTNDQARKMNQLIARCWSDAAFKKKLLADPAATLKAQGIETPAGVELEVHENTEKVMHFVLPSKPRDMSDEELEKLSAGKEGWRPAVVTQQCVTGF